MPSSPCADRPIARGMASQEIVCPVCSADLPLAGDEHSGEEVFCTVCGAPCRLKGEPGSRNFEVEEDF